MASLNIKNEDACRLAHELAQQNGETVTQAVTIALKERLERQKPRRKAGLAKWLNEVTRETAALMNDGRTSKEIMDELYDPETGLPI
jgi:antitoxin VapB